VITVAAALDGGIWFGTDEGASHLDEAGWTTYTTANGLVDDHVDSIAVGPDEAVWFGTPAGLTRFLPTGEAASEPTKQSEEASTSLPTSRLAYVKDGNIWLWNNGNKEQLTKDGRVDSLKFSGDGSWIAFTRARVGLVNELWVVRSDGRNERLLVSAEDLDSLLDIPRDKWTKGVVIFNYTWVPGMHTIAYETRREIEGTGTALSDDLRLVDVETGEQITQLASSQGGETYYSPDGMKVAIVTPQNISIMSADGKYLLDKVLEYSNVITYSEYSYYPKPVWSPDSRYLRVAIPFEDSLKEPTKPTEIWQIKVPGLSAGGWVTALEQPTLLVSIPAGFFLGSAVAFSPDLSHIAYSRRASDSEPMQVELHLANSDGTNDKVIQTGTSIEILGWAPDGQHFAFRFGHTESGGIAGLDGSVQTLDFNPLNFAWVDGETFTHVVDLGCAAELQVYKLDGDSQVIDRMWMSPVSSDSIK
jgi:Tol biopolymer transport system component